MAMYYYASKISAIACGTRCKQAVLQKSRGQRDRDKSQQNQHPHPHHHHQQQQQQQHHQEHATRNGSARDISDMCDIGDGGSGGIHGEGIYSLDTHNYTADTSFASTSALADGIRYRRRHSEQLDAYDIELGFQQIQLSTAHPKKSTAYAGYGYDSAHVDIGDIVQYDIPKNTFKRSLCDVNFESSVLGSGGIMYINGRIVSGPLDSLIEVLVPTNIIDLDKEFIFSFLLSSRLFLRPHELLGKLLDSVPDSECLESLVALLAEWTNKFPYDYRDERMMNHVKHIVASCSNSHLEAVVSKILSALLKRLTDLERHEADLRACQTNNDKLDSIKSLDCPTATQYAQILCRLEKKLAKHIGPEEFLQCSSNVLMDKQKKWDQPTAAGGPPGAQDPKKTCNLETYLDWSARLRLFVCNEILQCSGIRDRSKTVELWSGVAQYCLLVGNYNSATAILESLESPPIARLKITWSKLQVTCQQLDCMQRHAEGHGDLWQKQAIVLNENHQQQQQQQQRLQKQKQQQQKQQQHLKTDTAVVLLSTTSSTAAAAAASSPTTSSSTVATTTTTATSTASTTPGTESNTATIRVDVDVCAASTAATSGLHASEPTATGPTLTPQTTPTNNLAAAAPTHIAAAAAAATTSAAAAKTIASAANADVAIGSKKFTKPIMPTTMKATATATLSTASTSSLSSTTTTSTAAAAAAAAKPNDWVVIPVFADIVKLALVGREDCLRRLPNGHININAFDRMAAIVGAFTKHMHAVKSSGSDATTTTATTPTSTAAAAATAPTSSEYAHFCQHMQQTSKLSETELMMASFDCEEPNNAEKLMYDLN